MERRFNSNIEAFDFAEIVAPIGASGVEGQNSVPLILDARRMRNISVVALRLVWVRFVKSNYPDIRKRTLAPKELYFFIPERPNGLNKLF